MTLAIIFGLAVALLGFAAWKFLATEWNSNWRTRRPGTENNWQNEGYMANQDGKTWSEIDGTIADSAPPRRVGR